MEIFVEFLAFFSSIVLLALASQIVIKNAAKLAKTTGLGEIVIGFILLSVSTSIPEIGVAIFSVLSKNTELTIGNLLGANIINVCFIIGLGVAISKKPIKIKMGEMITLSLILFFSSTIPLALFVLGNVGYVVGISLLAIFFGFCIFSVKKRINLKERKEKKSDIKKSFVWLVFGLFFVIYSSMFVVDLASSISKLVGISQTVIGATIVALSTTLPELSVCLTAIKEGHPHLTLGDTIGSCLTNITLILGVVLILSEFRVDLSAFSTLIAFASASSLLLLYFLADKILTRKDGLILLSVFLLYLFLIYSGRVIEKIA
ncbi:MAG: sodium:calcium antiporter [Candidatus Aenigmatarchaeota archaeon]